MTGPAEHFRRPKWHLTPPMGWMNDPCAPFQDRDGVFHCYYQSSTEWTAEIGWGHAWSRDGSEWVSDREPVMMPGERGSYDHMGVFTGGLFPGTQNSDKLVYVYSAINDLVDNNKGYVNGQERLAIAVSSDRGISLDKQPELLSVHPPANVTGWRDPFISTWPALDRMTDTANGTYALLAGGLKGVGPTILLYRLPASSSAISALQGEWEYLGPLIVPVMRSVPPPSPWTGDLGENWECPSFFTLGKSEFIIVGSEGKWTDTTYPTTKVPMYQVWFSGQLEKTEDGVEFKRTAEGIVDWGNFYAAQVFKVNDGRTLCIGWLVDNDLTVKGRSRQGWAGAMSGLRELYMQETKGVLGTLSDDEQSIPPFEGLDSQAKDGSTVRTLGVRPIRELQDRRRAETKVTAEPSNKSSSFEVELCAAVIGDSQEIGLELVFVQGSAKIVFLPHKERIVIERKGTSHDADVNTDTEHGKHTLMRTAEGLEELELRLFYDHGILEIFANERFALSTRLYGGACGVRVISDEKAGEVRARRWDL